MTDATTDPYDEDTADEDEGSSSILRTVVECLEQNAVLQATTLGEPQLGKRDLYPATSVKEAGAGTPICTAMPRLWSALATPKKMNRNTISSG